MQFIEDDEKVEFNSSQGGFQNNCKLSHVIYMLRECVNYATENNSPFYTCFLDAEQASDRIWSSLL